MNIRYSLYSMVMLCLLGSSLCAQISYVAPSVSMSLSQDARDDLRAAVKDLVTLGKDIYRGYYIDSLALEGAMYKVALVKHPSKIAHEIHKSGLKGYIEDLYNALTSSADSKDVAPRGVYAGKMTIAQAAQDLKLKVDAALEKLMQILSKKTI